MEIIESTVEFLRWINVAGQLSQEIDADNAYSFIVWNSRRKADLEEQHKADGGSQSSEEK